MNIRRVDFGFFLRPREETETGLARVDPCLGYLIDHPNGRVLMDTGMGVDRDADAHYHPWRRPLEEALGLAGVSSREIGLVVNCHLHFDHCGGNPQLSGRPIFVQRTELEEARCTPDYTLPELVDAPRLSYEELDGEAEILPGVLVLPTPGHTRGHQSLVVSQSDGTVVVAGQVHNTASGFSAEVLAWRARRGGRDLSVPPSSLWMDRLQQLDPRRVVFAHDHAVWEP